MTPPLTCSSRSESLSMPSDADSFLELQTAFVQHEREVTISNFKIACVLGMLLMPAGILLDLVMYKDEWMTFLALRVLCSLLILMFLGVLLTPFGHKHYRLLGVTLFMLPASFIAGM